MFSDLLVSLGDSILKKNIMQFKCITNDHFIKALYLKKMHSIFETEAIFLLSFRREMEKAFRRKCCFCFGWFPTINFHPNITFFVIQGKRKKRENSECKKKKSENVANRINCMCLSHSLVIACNFYSRHSPRAF